MSVALPSPLRVLSGLTITLVAFTTYSLVAPSFTIVVLTILCVPALEFSCFSPLNVRVGRLFGSRPWIDALFLLIMAISWLGKSVLRARLNWC